MARSPRPLKAEHLLQHDSYLASVQYLADADRFMGVVQLIGPLIVFEGTSLSKLKGGFKAAITAYEAECEANDVKPEKSYSGRFNVRIKPSVHRQLVARAADRGVSLNRIVADALDTAVQSSKEVRNASTGRV
jgi:predicted HicB family RNase H-like nuclease